MKNIIVILLFGIHLYGCQLSDNSFTDSRDGKTYKTVKIGDQVWMAENLNYDVGEGSWCYNDSSSYCEKYGRLYTWGAAIRVAPKGWHLPNKEEFEQLINFLGGEKSAYKELIQDGSSGFNALFGGDRNSNGNCNFIGDHANFWSKTMVSWKGRVWYMSVNADRQEADMYGSRKDIALSVRLVKNTDNENTDSIKDEQKYDKRIKKLVSFTDSRDGKTYKTVKIGDQVWMAENLNYDYGEGSWCYNDSSSNCEKYGRLYTWEAARRSAPKGWHLPSDAEWTTLTTYLGGEDVADSKLKEADTTHWQSPNAGVTNKTGFTALPGGSRYLNSAFHGMGHSTDWWSSTEFDATNAWNRSMIHNYAYVYRHVYDKRLGFSVRCVKD